jgi:hypothetical protein
VSKTTVSLDQISVVIKGNFNAAIFSPLWLLDQKLIGTDEYSAAQIEVISAEFASFSTEWLRCLVVPDTLQLSTEEPAEFERVRDVAVGLLNALPHTPVAAVGINREIHFAAQSPEQYHGIGDFLVPKDFWQGLMEFPGTRSLTVWGVRGDELDGRVQVTVEPSYRFSQHVFLSHNDHFNLKQVDQHPSSRDEAWQAQYATIPASAKNIPAIIEILTSSWISSINRSTEVMNALARIK